MATNFISRSTTKSSEWFFGSVYHRIIQGIVYVAVFLVPLWYLPFTSSILELNKQFLVIGLAALALMVWLVGVVVSGKITLRTTLFDKGILALAGASLVATVFSRMPLRSIFGAEGFVSSSFLSIISLTVLYFLIVHVVPGRGRSIRLLLSVSLLTALLIGILQMFGLYLLPGAFTHTRAFTTVGMFHALGILGALALPFFAKTVSPSSGRMPMGISIFGVVLSIIVLAAINSWALWVIALVGMLATIAFDSVNMGILAEETKRDGRSPLVRFLVPMLVVVLGTSFLLVRPTYLKGKLPTELTPSYGLTGNVVAEVLKERPVTGVGPENFTIAFDQFGARHISDTALLDARMHDGIGEAFTLAVQTGALGIIALGIIIWCLVQVFRKFGVAIAESQARGENISFVHENSGTLAALAGLTVGLFLYPFSITLLTIWFVLLALAGMSVAEGTARIINLEERPTISLFTSLGFMAGFVVVLVTTYFFTTRYLADIRYAHAFRQTKAVAVLDDLMQAINLNGHSDWYLRDASQATLSVAREEVGKGTAADGKKLQNLMASAIQLAQKATDVAPAESLNWENLGKVYLALIGSIDNVEELADAAYQKASEVRPGDPTFDNEAGQLWLTYAELLRRTTGQSSDAALARAEKAFQRALTSAPTFGLAIYNLGATYERQGKIDEAIDQLERVAPANADNASVLFQLGLLYIRAGKFPEARRMIQQVVLLAPAYADARWYYALLLEYDGDIDGALAQLSLIQKTNSNNTALANKISQLEAGQQSPGSIIDNKPLSQ